MQLRNLERDVLAAARAYGEFAVHHRDDLAWDSLCQQYPQEPHRNRITTMIIALIESGHLVEQAAGILTIRMVLGLTPMGEQRLYELDHPRLVWVKANWFPLAVAVVTTCVAIAQIVTSVVISP